MTAKDLLTKLMDYQYLWAFPQRIDSKPATVRKQQIESLQRAFGLSSEKSIPDNLISPPSIEYLLRGEFLLKRSLEKNKELAERIKTIVALYPPYIASKEINESTDFRWMFNDLYNYRMEIYKIVHTDSVALEEVSPGLLYSQYLQHKLKEVIKNNLTEIDETLWIILDPEKRTLDREVLVESYGYPLEDLDKIDLEWRLNGHLPSLNNQLPWRKKEPNGFQSV